MNHHSIPEEQGRALYWATRVLIAHGWTEEQRVHHAAQVLADHSLAQEFTANDKSYDPEGPEAKAHLEQAEHTARNLLNKHNCVDAVLSQVEPSSKPGFLRINEDEIDPMDGVALDMLERTVRFHLDLSGELQDDFIAATNLLTVENAQSFLKALQTASPDEPVMVRGIGDRLPLYVTPVKGRALPELNVPAIAAALQEEYSDFPAGQAEEMVKDFQGLMEAPYRRAQVIVDLQADRKHELSSPGMG